MDAVPTPLRHVVEDSVPTQMLFAVRITYARAALSVTSLALNFNAANLVNLNVKMPAVQREVCVVQSQAIARIPE